MWYSGKNTNRPSFQKLLEDIKRESIAKIVVYMLDRISRNLLYFTSIYQGSFKFPIKFNMFGIEQYIRNAVFDTGYSQSLISVANLDLVDYNIEELKEM